MIDIKGLNKAEVATALYNQARPQGMGWLTASSQDATVEQIREAIGGRLRFDYVAGRSMKVDISDDEFDEWLYDRDNGAGAAERAIAPLRGK